MVAQLLCNNRRAKLKKFYNFKCMRLSSLPWFLCRWFAASFLQLKIYCSRPFRLSQWSSYVFLMCQQPTNGRKSTKQSPQNCRNEFAPVPFGGHSRLFVWLSSKNIVIRWHSLNILFGVFFSFLSLSSPIENDMDKKVQRTDSHNGAKFFFCSLRLAIGRWWILWPCELFKNFLCTRWSEVVAKESVVL